MLARECPEKTFAVTARDANGTLVGGVVAMYAGETLVSAMWGADYEVFGKLPLYFEICYYRILSTTASWSMPWPTV